MLPIMRTIRFSFSLVLRAHREEERGEKKRESRVFNCPTLDDFFMAVTYSAYVHEKSIEVLSNVNIEKICESFQGTFFCRELCDCHERKKEKKNKGDPKSLDEAPLKLSVTQAAVLWRLRPINTSHKMKSKMLCDVRAHTHTHPSWGLPRGPKRTVVRTEWAASGPWYLLNLTKKKKKVYWIWIIGSCWVPAGECRLG